jgi:outer membrane protein assembly factor BamB
MKVTVIVVVLSLLTVGNLIACNDTHRQNELILSVSEHSKWGSTFESKPKELWSSGFNNYPESFDVIDNVVVVIKANGANLEAFDINNGKTLWGTSFTEKSHGKSVYLASKVGRDTSLPTDKLFVMRYVEDLSSYEILQLDEKTGEVLVDKSMALEQFDPTPYHNAFYYDKYSNSIYLLNEIDDRMLLQSYDAGKLKIKWTYQYPDSEISMNHPCFNYLDAASKDYVMVSYGDGYSCLNSDTGEVIWSETNEYCYTKLCRNSEINSNFITMHFQSHGGGHLLFHDSKTGELLWEDELEKWGNQPFCKVIHLGDRSVIYVASNDSRDGYDMFMLSSGKKFTGFRISTDVFEVIQHSIFPSIEFCYVDKDVFMALTPLSISCHSLEHPDFEPGYIVPHRLIWTYYTKNNLDLNKHGIENNISLVNNMVIVSKEHGKIVYTDNWDKAITCLGYK